MPGKAPADWRCLAAKSAGCTPSGADVPSHDKAVMVIIDTSVWITHFRSGNAELKNLLLEAEVALHPFVFGELACGNFSDRNNILSLLSSLPSVVVAEHNEFIELIEQKKLWGAGLGFVDVHLLASARISSLSIFTYDKPLASAARKLDVFYNH